MSVLNTITRLWRFHGGLHVPEHKAESNSAAIEALPLPAQLVLPLQQHIGAAARACVRVGERVHKGDALARADGYISAALHAPTSGTVVAIEPRPVAHPSGIPVLSVVLESDGRDEWGPNSLPTPIEDYLRLDPAYLRERVREAGIVGLGGAAFPTAVKLNAEGAIRVLVLNAAECEPYITCDDRLMRERAHAVIGGLLLMRRALGVKDCIIGIEDNKPEAAAALQAALEQFADDAEDVLLQQIPTLYPSGSEQQLIRVLTGVEIGRSRRPVDSGILCQNVATAAAVHDAVTEGRPLISRVVTVTGSGISTPRNLEVLIGTPLSALIEYCGGYTPRAARLIIGGPMMGLALPGDDLPITKGMNCVLVAGADDVSAPEESMPCIRCGECMNACPANLLPQQMYWHARAREFDKAQQVNLFDCIECGCCAAVCPSHLPLVQYYRFAKTEIWAAEREKKKAEQARARHEFHLYRLEREEAEKAARLQAKKSAAQQRGHEAETPAADPKQAAIAAALARAQAKKAAAKAEATAGESSNELSPEQLEKLAAARARAEAKRLAATQTAGEAANDATAALSPEQLEKLAAARARAEAKKAASAPAQANADAAPALSPEQLEKLAAARARAEAKKAASAPAQANADAAPALSPEQLEKLAAARARAEAKKAASAPAQANADAAPALTPEQLEKLAAARARAEAKKAASAPAQANADAAPALSPEQIEKLTAARVRTEAKKAAQEALAAATAAVAALDADAQEEAPTASPAAEATPAPLTEEQLARLAAARARAEAKKAAQSGKPASSDQEQ
ncbi:electron transport complex subunit RsxC [Plasticicumulans acidivorans]|uniref:Ion-translocating oxidoreductase complex subunit C n=1 Tax=Plasticicumulans acidivorans TaxID=886464 RepID=A0A317MUC5_9GAMM|nr:electron transport complex subunit RsxC [Plasticicumulans acidivorans]PWV60666.1 RnfABCDGE-type electron transport complex C subunit [Plasticicumulans acidivorans]